MNKREVGGADGDIYWLVSEGLFSKAPNSKHQAPEKNQTPNIESARVKV
jgi:hypothetical protein